MILAKTASSILPLLIIVFNFLGLDEDLEGLSILIQYPIYCIAAAMIILLFIALFFYFDWKTKTLYQFPERLLFEYGILNKQKITVRYENVATVDIYRPLIYRFWGLAKLKIDSNTISSQNVRKSEIVLILKHNFAEQMKNELMSSVLGNEIQSISKESSVMDSAEKTSLLVLSRGKVMLMMMLSALMGVIIFVPVAISVIFSILIPLLNFQYADIILFSFLGLGGIVCIMFVITLISSLLLYHNFTLSSSKQRLHLSYGLMDIKNVTIPYRKINGFKLSQNILQRFLNLYSVSILSAGYGDEQNELQSVIAPSATEKEAFMIIKQVYGDVPDFSEKMRPTGAAKVLYFLPAMVLTILSILILLLNTSIVTGIAFFGVLIAFAVIAGFLQYRNTGLSYENDYFRLDKGGIFRSVIILPLNRCQMATMKSGPIQRLYKKGTINIKLFSSAKGYSDIISLRHMSKELIRDFFVR